MDSETPIVKYVAGAVGIIIVCFCLGYFVLGPRTRNEVATVPLTSTPAPSPSPLAVSVGAPPQLAVDETTQDREAARKKAEEEKKKAEDAAKKKAEEEARKAQEAADQADSLAGSPSPEPTPVGDQATPTPAEPLEPGKDNSAPSTPETLFRVRLDKSFESRDEAEAVSRELAGRFGKPMIVADARSGKFQIQVGAFRDKKSADSRQQELKNNGYEASVLN